MISHKNKNGIAKIGLLFGRCYKFFKTKINLPTFAADLVSDVKSGLKGKFG